jgi:hypothetical protein
LTLKVEEVSGAGVRLRMEGIARLADDADCFDRFDLVAIGTYDSNQKIIGNPYPLTLGVAFELAAPDSLGYGQAPSGIRDHLREQFIDYLGPAKGDAVRRYLMGN